MTSTKVDTRAETSMQSNTNSDGSAGKGGPLAPEASELPYFSLNETLVSKIPQPTNPASVQLDPTKEHQLLYVWNISEMSAAEKPSYGKYDYSKNQSYASDSIHQVAEVKTLGDFWSVWNYLPQPSDLFEGKKLISARDQQPVGAIMMFRKGIRPEWEDPLNSNGGEFQFKMTRKLFPKRESFASADECWNNLVCGIIGGTILPSSMVTGIRLLDRMSAGKNPLIRVEVWFTDPPNLSKPDQEILSSKFNNDYKSLISALYENMETAMLTRLDGSYDATNKFWEDVTPSMHSVQHKK